MPIKLIKVLIVDDSPTARTMFRHIINSEPDLRVVGEALNGRQAVKMAGELRPDIILMDAVMPDMDGLEATREIMHLAPTPIVIVSSSTDEKEANLAFKAFSNGALTAIRKPPGPRDPDYQDGLKEIVTTLRTMASVQVIHRWKADPAPAVIQSSSNMLFSDLAATPKIVAIVASTGGPSALSEIVGHLPIDFPLPVVIVQHITADFIPSLVTWLNSVTPLNVSIAQNAIIPRPGHIYVAPGDVHLRLTRGLRFELNRTPDSVPHIPSGDIFLESIAQAYGTQAIGIVLTGMGEDGARGLHAMSGKGALTIAQDEATSVVYGMPGQAVALGAARYILPLSQIAPVLAELMKARNAVSARPTNAT